MLPVHFSTVPSWCFLHDSTVPLRCFLPDGTVPSRCFLRDSTVLSRCFLRDGTVPSYNHYQNFVHTQMFLGPKIFRPEIFLVPKTFLNQNVYVCLFTQIFEKIDSSKMGLPSRIFFSPFKCI